LELFLELNVLISHEFDVFKGLIFHVLKDGVDFILELLHSVLQSILQKHLDFHKIVFELLNGFNELTLNFIKEGSLIILLVKVPQLVLLEPLETFDQLN
jgi:hypothetical protein